MKFVVDLTTHHSIDYRKVTILLGSDVVKWTVFG